MSCRVVLLRRVPGFGPLRVALPGFRCPGQPWYPQDSPCEGSVRAWADCKCVSSGTGGEWSWSLLTLGVEWRGRGGSGDLSGESRFVAELGVTVRSGWAWKARVAAMAAGCSGKSPWLVACRCAGGSSGDEGDVGAVRPVGARHAFSSRTQRTIPLGVLKHA